MKKTYTLEDFHVYKYDGIDSLYYKFYEMKNHPTASQTLGEKFKVLFVPPGHLYYFTLETAEITVKGRTITKSVYVPTGWDAVESLVDTHGYENTILERCDDFLANVCGET